MLDAATELLLEGGFAAATFVQIGKRAGYSRGLVTTRFGSKAGLLDALIDHIVIGWLDRTLKPMQAKDNGLEGALVLLEGIWRQVARDDRQLRALYIMMFDSITAEPALQARMAELHEFLRFSIATSLRRGIADGSVKPSIDPDLEAALLLSTLRGVTFQWMLDPDRFDPVPALKQVHATTADRIGEDIAVAAPVS
jgi:AcrR family transcriptional regulator